MKSGSVSASQPSQPAAPPMLRLHWLGKQQLAQETNATNFLALWNLPESARLEAQTLDKLATAPWRLLAAVSPLSNAPVSSLRPLLDDFVPSESYLEVRGGSNAPLEGVLAVRLSADRAALWQSNLPVVLKSLVSGSLANTDTGFQLLAPNVSISLTRASNWTLLSLTAPAPTRPAAATLLADLTARIQRTGQPAAARATNYWVEVAAQPAVLAHSFGLSNSFLSDLVRLEYSSVGSGTSVLSQGSVELSPTLALPVQLAAWNLPTNFFTSSALVSFTAARGLSALQSKLDWFRRLEIGPAPDQVCVWAMGDMPMQTFLSFPETGPTNQFELLSSALLQHGNAWLNTNSIGDFARTDGQDIVVWQGAPFMSPFLRPLTAASNRFMCFGLIPSLLTNRLGTNLIAARVQERPELVYYDWEFTGPRLTTWLYIGQLARVIFGRAQLANESPAVLWLQALSPKLQNTGTFVTRESTNLLHFRRTSDFGLTAFELHVLADWFESPEFPYGTHTSLLAVKRKLSRAPAPVPAPH